MKDKPSQSVQGPQTNIYGDANGPILSGMFQETVTLNYNAPSGSFRIPIQKPPRPEKFIGREKELTDLLRDLQPGRSITICGPGGIGKTAFVAETIWRLVPNNNPPDTFPDGIIFHDFYRQPQADLALEAIARAYGEDLRPSLSEAARRALAGRQALLVLDGTEAVDDLEAILSVAGSCGILITTRRHSDAPADWSDLPSLPMEQAIQLLKFWGHEWVADEAASKYICELVGCLPLAVQLVGRYLAYRCQLAIDYLDWLKETPLVALDMGQRQHQSIPLLMERSLAQVDESARTCLGVIGILAIEPFNPELIAIALEITEQEANRILGVLVDYGLLIRPNFSYQVTHALIHTFAREKLVPRNSALVRLAYHYYDFVITQSSIGLSGYSNLDDHLAHILAVQSACLEASEWKAVYNLAWAMVAYLDLRGHWIERATVLEAALLAARKDCALYFEGAILNSIGTTYNNLGNYRQAIEFLEQSLSIARRIKDYQGEGAALSNIGNAYLAIGNIQQAIKFYEQHLSIARKIKDRHGEGGAMGNIGIAYYYLGQIQQAIEFYEQDLAIAREIEDRRGEGKSLCCLGVGYLKIGETRRAIEFFKKHLAISREIGDRQGEGNALCNLGLGYEKLGETQQSIEFYDQSLLISREIRDRLAEGHALWNVSLVLNELGQLAQAIDRAQSALSVYEQIENPQAEKVRQKLAEWKRSE